MDNLSKLSAMLGDKEISDKSIDCNEYSHARPKHLYEGTDSDDEEMATRGVNVTKGKRDTSKSQLEPESEAASKPFLPNDFKEYQLQVGELAAEGESFCPFQTIKKYPYVYIGNANRQRVAEGFFDRGQLFDRTWDFFYLYRSPREDPNEAALILVPTKQFEHFLRTINNKLSTHLSIPSGSASSGFQVTFESDGMPRPRYLGRATNRDTAENLRVAVPPSYYKLDGEPDVIGTPSERSVIAFKAKVDLILQAQKGKKLVNQEKQKINRIAKQQSWNHSIKRVQRYLGIRQASNQKQIEAVRKGLENSGLGWGEYDAAVQAAAVKLPPTMNFHPDNLAPYAPEGTVVFVCVDFEAWERDHKKITEIGIATLDTEDLQAVIPGEGGVNWLPRIRARHFRINEHKHLNNSEFVDGCADRFEFGTSEFISLKDAPHIIASCFKPPFSNPDEKSAASDIPKRNIILVGHDVTSDINYLRTIGYNVHNLSNLQEIVDTASMWRYVKRDTNPRNLGSILAELGILGWNLHNAGNDATYTLQAMIMIAIRDLEERQKLKDLKYKEMKERDAESVKEAALTARDRGQGWSSSGENSDGGLPAPPMPSYAIGSQKEGPSSQSQDQAKATRPLGPINQSSGNNGPSRNTFWETPQTANPSRQYASSQTSSREVSNSNKVINSESRSLTENDSKFVKLMSKTMISTEKTETKEGNRGQRSSCPLASSEGRNDDDSLTVWM